MRGIQKPMIRFLIFRCLLLVEIFELKENIKIGIIIK